MRFTRRPSPRDVRNHLAGLTALVTGKTPVFEQAREYKPRGRQPESKVNDAVKEWACVRNGVLYRNRRGMVDLPNGGKMPIGLGPNGTGDLVGYIRVQITPEMVGRTLPIYTEIESKTETGRLADHQLARIEELRDADAISGCARNAEDAERLLQRWRER